MGFSWEEAKGADGYEIALSQSAIKPDCKILKYKDVNGTLNHRASLEAGKNIWFCIRAYKVQAGQKFYKGANNQPKLAVRAPLSP